MRNSFIFSTKTAYIFRRNLFIVILFTFNDWIVAQPPFPPIPETNIRAKLSFLSSDWFEGRKTGEKGNEMAADYLAAEFEEMGLMPLQTVGFPKAASTYREVDSSYYQWVPMFRTVHSENKPLIVATRTESVENISEFSFGDDFFFSTGNIGHKLSIKSPVVFAGYGISMPEKGYDDFNGIDVAGKVVLISMGYPGYRDTTSPGYRKMQEFNINNNSRWDKYKAAVKMGASAVLFLYTTLQWFDPTGSEYHNYTYEEKKPAGKKSYLGIAADSSEQNIPFIMISSRVGQALLSGTGINLMQYDIKNATDCKPASGLLKNKTMELEISGESELISSPNIIGTIPGENPADYIVVCAHYDHKGKNQDEIFYGCDDNASGSVAVMAIAKACIGMNIKPKSNIIFALWTGEEDGLLGSRYFTEKWNNGTINACFNFDMVGRYNPKDSANYLTVTLPKGLEEMQEALTKVNQADSLNLKTRYVYETENEYGGSDYASFAVRKIPFCWFFTGFHDDYHKKTDTYEKANVADMKRIVHLGFKTIWETANRK